MQYMARRAMYNVLGTLGANIMKLLHKFGLPLANGVFNAQAGYGHCVCVSVCLSGRVRTRNFVW